MQISNGGEEVRIIELFKDNFDVTVEKPESIGKVQLMSVEQGVVSDDACAVNPCENGGTCHVTWNDFHCQCQEGVFLKIYFQFKLSIKVSFSVEYF